MAKHFKTVSGIPLSESYSSPNAPGSESPGKYPFTRGIHPSMYRGKIWTMRQYAGFGTAHEANERYRYLLAQGTTGLSVAFDLPTQMGRDSDHALSKGEVGKVGVAICSVDDMEVLLDQVPLEKVSVSMTINATAGILLAFLLAVAERRSISWGVLSGTIQNDILKEYIARGTYIYPPRPALRIFTDILAFCGEKVPKWNTVSISGYHIREAGSTAVQELAFTLADGIAYVEAAKKAGLHVDTFGERLAFFFNCHNDFFEEIAKFRAARKLWANIMKERFGAKNPRAMMLRFHTQTAGSTLTAQQPHNNIVRTTVQALAAVLGGTQSLHTNSFDEALGLPTQDAATLALRTQQLLATEAGVAAVADPLGGSYFIEELTASMEREVKKLLDSVEARGGMLAAIEARFPQQEIERSAYEYQREIESNERIIVGVNAYQGESFEKVEILRANPKGEAEQCARLDKLKSTRDANKVKACLTAIMTGAQGDANLMPLIVEAVKNRATLGEVADVLRTVFGEYREGA